MIATTGKCCITVVIGEKVSAVSSSLLEDADELKIVSFNAVC